MLRTVNTEIFEQLVSSHKVSKFYSLYQLGKKSQFKVKLVEFRFFTFGTNGLIATPIINT